MNKKNKSITPIYKYIDTDSYTITIENTIMFIVDKVYMTNADTQSAIEFIELVISLLDEYKIKYLVFDFRCVDEVMLKIEGTNILAVDAMEEAVNKVNETFALKMILFVSNKVHYEGMLRTFYSNLLRRTINVNVVPDMLSALVILNSIKIGLFDYVTVALYHPMLKLLLQFVTVGFILLGLLSNRLLFKETEQARIELITTTKRLKDILQSTERSRTGQSK